MAQKFPDIASRLRQGKLESLEGNVIILHFENIFQIHREYLETEESFAKIEVSLEDEFESYLKIRFRSGMRKENISEALQASDSIHDDEAYAKYNKDKKIQILQTILGATIRNVLTDYPKIPYSLGDSCNFNEV